ncbi:hypothetical protein A2524_02240 [Candidatus Wolfebacteria bacterium RIFOXYD12_FULL_48_21]|uniref:DNA helicase UvrD n=1 Tax=Candidatus Wolfebacteria bacterium RIFOXYD1_FULL_48_65 TaxID=1802561 RepID=A0A1F8E4C3_9BACT|nr:MAG: hypothetical protein A2524_02240 [Candidatus Wolfebacteria bacterium RIFOXYD12_FULL_48_21]OGM95540.1 MAG: hypothetical protein A2610_02035 [Candidatus Wolfebacteria bacterium RIFOXYD1_FULL_48_65]OGM96050.1 MAG: hypothetical protein A2532_00490 [Candidatus Wolfebacteria bacterium RIFOXYD2_FULL_48_11]
MKFIADLHMHSKYSRATSKNMILEEIDRVAGEKGITVIGTGDCTHPKWFKELTEKLEQAEPGLFKLKKKHKRPMLWETLADTRFIISGEISSIYSRGGKVRRVHNIILLPSLESAKRLNVLLGKRGNIVSDGRPILGIDSEELAKIIFDIEPTAMIIPAHLWTPWFGVLGSASGFDSLEECYGAYADRIIAVETGLSSDPAMNWRLSKLDGVAMLSNSDSHSPQKIGREATMFDTELSYEGIRNAIKNSSPRNISRRVVIPAEAGIQSLTGRTTHKELDPGPRSSRGQALTRRGDTQKIQNNCIIATLEFFPEEGKYFHDGHRTCGMSMTPKETKKNKGMCPVCGKPVTVGVLNRVDALADTKTTVTSKGNMRTQGDRVPFYSIIQLNEIIADALSVGVKTKKVQAAYERLLKGCGTEIDILMNAPKRELLAHADERIVRGIMNMRAGEVAVIPGYDGEYGKIHIS